MTVPAAADLVTLRNLLRSHVEAAGSRTARTILRRDRFRSSFHRVAPIAAAEKALDESSRAVNE